jgi:gamma-glutamyl-gamma-aminobutyrate hydrolase PuuD
MIKVFIVCADYAIGDMFRERGYEIVTELSDADIVQFTGGADVSPGLYGEDEHPRTYFTPMRDANEKMIYDNCLAMGTPMLGICRGGQFLNVMNGGKLYQDVRGHAMQGLHECFDLLTGRRHMVSSTHHQMMRMGATGKLLAIATHIGKDKQHMADGQCVTVHDDVVDTEAVFYENSISLCFQPHPEYGYAADSCRDLYFSYIEKLILPYLGYVSR